MPFAERAAQRCERPVLSSTRQSSRVSPSGRNTAPALKTLLIGEGQLFRLRIGLPPYRVKRGTSVHSSCPSGSRATEFCDEAGVVTKFKRRHSFPAAVHFRSLL